MSETIYNNPAKHDFRLVGEARQISVIIESLIEDARFLVRNYTETIVVAVTLNDPVAGQSKILITIPEGLVTDMEDRNSRIYTLQVQFTDSDWYHNILSGELSIHSERA